MSAKKDSETLDAVIKAAESDDVEVVSIGTENPVKGLSDALAAVAGHFIYNLDMPVEILAGCLISAAEAHIELNDREIEHLDILRDSVASISATVEKALLKSADSKETRH